jgi:hypothetical protein
VSIISVLILLESNRRQQFQPGKPYAFSKKLFSDMFESMIKNLFSPRLTVPGLLVFSAVPFAAPNTNYHTGNSVQEIFSIDRAK